MARLNTFDDSEWDEVMIINGYAVFIGYLMIGVRGLGVLVITWTTVVLLGGFVSVLGKKDFWCLTGITLVQTAGVINFLLAETITDLGRSSFGLLGAVTATVFKPFTRGDLSDPEDDDDGGFKRLVLALVLWVIQVLVLAVIVIPAIFVYLFGMYISAGISLWRLIEHDYSSADGGANLKPALQVLYSLALAQGVLFGYKTIHALGVEFRLVELVTEQLGREDKDVVSDYLKYTVAGCEKDPSFVTGRNLVTYAVDLMMDSKSNDGFIDGVKILSTIIVDSPSRKEVAKHLLMRSTFSSHMFQRLLDTLGAISPYSTEIREQAASIVALVASSIHLEQCPGWIESISSLVDTFEGYIWVPEDHKRDDRLPKGYERDWMLEGSERECLLESIRKNSSKKESISKKSTVDDSNDLHDSYRRLVKQGLIILQKLTVHEDNCRVIINTEGLLLKITEPLISKQLHRDHHDVWSDIADASLELIKRLIANSLGNTRTELLGSEIFGSERAIIRTLKSILECLECEARIKRGAVEILLYLNVDTSSITASESSARRLFTWILLLVSFLKDRFADDEVCCFTQLIKRNQDIRRLAGDKLSAMLPLQQSNEGSDRIMLQSFCAVLEDITRALVDAGNISNRVHAAKVLEYLCHNGTKNDEYLKELKNSMVPVMREVLKEILGNVRPAVMDANNFMHSLHDIDLESGGVPQGNCQENTSCSQQQTGEQPADTELWKALVSLCNTVSCEWYGKYSDLPLHKTVLTIRQWHGGDSDLCGQLDDIAAQVCSELGKSPAKGFYDLVEESKELLGKKLAEQSASAPAS